MVALIIAWAATLLDYNLLARSRIPHTNTSTHTYEWMPSKYYTMVIGKYPSRILENFPIWNCWKWKIIQITEAIRSKQCRTKNVSSFIGVYFEVNYKAISKGVARMCTIFFFNKFGLIKFQWIKNLQVQRSRPVHSSSIFPRISVVSTQQFLSIFRGCLL